MTVKHAKSVTNIAKLDVPESFLRKIGGMQKDKKLKFRIASLEDVNLIADIKTKAYLRY